MLLEDDQWGYGLVVKRHHNLRDTFIVWWFSGKSDWRGEVNKAFIHKHKIMP